MSEKSQRERLVEEHRNFRQKIDSLQSECAYSREINAEYLLHQARISKIINPEDTPVAGTDSNA